MAYQHLFGSASGGTSGAGYKTLASTPEFYNVMTDDELSNYNNYSFVGGDEHPVKFCHYYKEYKKCFIQSAVSFEYDYVGRNSSIAHTLVLTESESDHLLKEHVCPFSPGMFMNARSDDFARPATEFLPDTEYRFLECADREHVTAIISKFFRSDDFAKFIFAILLSAENGYPVYVSLPGTPRESSFNAIRLMNAIIPAFPAEYKKKLGFMTHVTDTYAYEDVSVYFTTGIELRRQFMGSAYCFDLSGNDSYIGGIDDVSVKENRDLIRAVIGNVLTYDTPALNEYYNDILPNIDSYDRFSLSKINDIFCMWRFLSGQESDAIDSDSACRIITSFYDFYDIVDNKAKFLYRINSYWEKEIEKCRAGGYAPSTDVFDVVNRHYPRFGEDDKRAAQRIWSFLLIYSLQGGNAVLFDKLISFGYRGSQLADDVFDYILYMYAGFICRKDTNTSMKDVYEKIVGGMIKNAFSGKDASNIFGMLAKTISAFDRYYDEMSLDKSTEYDVFAPAFLSQFENGVADMIKNAGLISKFEVIRSLRENICVPGSELGTVVYEHFFSSCFIQSVKSGFTKECAAKMAEDRNVISDFVTRADEYPELNNIEDIAVFRMLYDIIFGKRGIGVLLSFSSLVNKPEKQRMLAEWCAAYNSKAPEFILSLLAYTTCSIVAGGSMEFNVDYLSGYKAFYEATGCDREQTLRELNRFITELESDMQKPDYKQINLSAFREPTAEFLNEYFFSKEIERKTLKDNESMMKRFDKVKAVRDSSEGKEKRHRLFGKK